MSLKNVPITVAYGDGIGPEIMDATLAILKAAGARLDIETIEIGESVYKKGFQAGIEPSAWESLQRTNVFLKAPITTPQGGGFKSLNVTVRKRLGLFANVRPCVAYAPYVRTRHPNMDVVIIRENEEDLYAGIEYRHTQQMYQCLKLISQPGCERIIRYAFEYAKAHGRKKVTCFSKDNIMKMTDGLFHKVFDEIAKEYQAIESEHYIVDIGAAKLADTPEKFDVVVMENLYGDILSDVAAQIAGSVGLAGSSNIGEKAAMFEAIHGSAPKMGGQNRANPSGLLLAGVMMLSHIGQSDIAQKIHNAWLKTLEDGLHTYDIFSKETSQLMLGTKEFAQAVINNLGQAPKQLSQINYKSQEKLNISAIQVLPQTHAAKCLVGVDIFVDHPSTTKDLAQKIQKALQGTLFQMKMMTNRGVVVWPDAMEETFCTDHFRCRFLSTTQYEFTAKMIVSLMDKLIDGGVEIIKSENLYDFDGTPGYTSGQGE